MQAIESLFRCQSVRIASAVPCCCRQRRHLTRLSLSAFLLLFFAGAVSPALTHAQSELLDSRWLRAESPHFTFISQASARRTERLASEFEQWRAGVAPYIPGSALPVAGVPNYVYVFTDQEALAHFSFTQDSAFFYATPRANFMALLEGDADSISLARHHYAHFLIRNFSDLRLPRWYEEGLAAFLARIEAGRSALDFEQYSARNNSAMASISSAFSMERLLFQDQALASPRNLQIANLKAESLFYYLSYGYQLDGFPDRRNDLQSYLDYLFDNRNARFAYDLSFDVTPAQLDAEFLRFIEQSDRPRVQLIGGSNASPEIEAQTLEERMLPAALGELALNGGRPDTAQLFFEAGTRQDQPQARNFSGLGDALRFQELEGRDQEIAAYFETALEIAPEDVNIVLDYGEYWEAELLDCDKVFPAAEREFLISEIERSFNKALNLAADLPEVHLALGQLALLPERNWRDGSEHHRRAFALLPGDSFIMEQAARYAIEEENFERADFLIDKMAQSLHSYGEPAYVSALRERAHAKQRGEYFEHCAREE